VLVGTATRSHRACVYGYWHCGSSPALYRLPSSRRQESPRLQACCTLEATTTGRGAYQTTQFYAGIGRYRRLRLSGNLNLLESHAAGSAGSPARDGSTAGRSCERRWIQCVRALANAACCTRHRAATAGYCTGDGIGRTALGCAGASFVDFAIVIECRRRPPVWASGLIALALAARQCQLPLESESEVARKASSRRPTCHLRCRRLSGPLAGGNPMSVHTLEIPGLYAATGTLAYEMFRLHTP
jgi:hypothetical protein